MKNNSVSRVKHSLRKKMILYIVIPLIIIYALAVYLTYDLGRATAIAHTKNYLVELTGHNAAELDNLFCSVSASAESIADTVDAIIDIDDDELFSLIKAKINRNDDIYGMAIAYEPGKGKAGRELYSPYFFRKGSVLAYTDLAEKYNYLSCDWYRIPKGLGAPYWTEPYFDEGGGDELMITYSHPVIDKGELIAVATADVSLNELEEVVSGISIMGGYTFIVSRTGTFLYHPIKDYVMRESIFSLARHYNMPDIRKTGRKMVEGESGIASYPDVETGEKKWIVYTPIESCDWSFAAVIPEAEILTSIRRSIMVQSLLLLVGLFVIIFLIIWVSIGITRPVRKLALYAEHIADGNLESKIEKIKGNDEIGELGRIFNEMAENLKAHIASLMKATKAREAVESELRIARQIQESLLPGIFPAFPENKEFDLYGRNLPAKEVAGDFYDFYFIDPERLGLMIADVSGKGISAGLYMVIARTLAKILCRDKESSPAGVLTEANKILCQDNDTCMFITLFLAYYNIFTGETTYANAGHKGSLILSKEGLISELEGLGNMAMGISPGEIYREKIIKLKREDTLILYTDGITDATGDDGSFYGSGRFMGKLSNSVHLPLKETVDNVCRDLENFQKDNQFDDITLLLLKRLC